MKNINKFVVLLGLTALVTSCRDNETPNYQYMPNMYESIGYETNGESEAFANGKVGQDTPNGAVKRGYVPYEYPNTMEGYNAAKATLKSPLDPATVDMEKAKVLFDTYCAICHGEKGDGTGNLVKREKFLGVPNYKDREINEGSIFHVETYGLNAMGSHANQLNTNERWLVASYVMKLKSEL